MHRFEREAGPVASYAAVTWPRIFAIWDAVELDMFDRGIDLDDAVLLGRRTWSWFCVRLFDVIATKGTRSNRLLAPPPAAAEPADSERTDD